MGQSKDSTLALAARNFRTCGGLFYEMRSVCGRSRTTGVCHERASWPRPANRFYLDDPQVFPRGHAFLGVRVFRGHRFAIASAIPAAAKDKKAKQGSAVKNLP